MTEYWIVPCNTKYFDIVEHFKHTKHVVWKNMFTICPGDFAYIYLGSPYGEIRYKCIVVSNSVSDEVLAQNAYAIPKKKNNNYFSKKEKYIVMELITEFPEGSLTFQELRDHGLGQVQIQARMDQRLRRYVQDIETRIKERYDA